MEPRNPTTAMTTLTSSAPTSFKNTKRRHRLSVLQLWSHNLAAFSVLYFFAATYLAQVDAVHINSISAPAWYRAGSAASVILDCDFSLEPDDSLVVVKWFLNDDPQHIYQWIQSRDKRTYSRRIKPYVDETFVVSDHPTRHRALRLLNPPASLSGKYTCSVSSIENEDSNSTHLVIYEPASAFDIAAVEVDEDRPDSDGFNITCTAIGVYPEPEIRLYKVRSPNENENLESHEIESNSSTLLSFLSMSDGLYSSTLVSHIEQPKSSANSTTTLSPVRERLVLNKRSSNETKTVTLLKTSAEHYECRLTIPHSDYVEVRRLAIQEGWRSKYRTNGAQSLQQQTGLLCTSLFLLLLLGGIQVLAVGHHRM